MQKTEGKLVFLRIQVNLELNLEMLKSVFLVFGTFPQPQRIFKTKQRQGIDFYFSIVKLKNKVSYQALWDASLF